MWCSTPGCGAAAVVLDVELDAHRLLARVFLGDFRGQAGDAADDEHEAAGRRREAHVVEHGGERAVDVHRQRLDARARPPPPARVMKAMPSPATRFGPRHLEQHRDARIRRVDAMAEARQPPLLGDGLGDGSRAPPLRREPVARRRREAVGDELHAVRAGAAVLVADGQDAAPRPPRRSTGGCPRRPAAPPRTTARRRRDRRRRSGWRRAAAARRPTAAGRDAAATIVSVNVASLHQRRDARARASRCGSRRSRDRGAPRFHERPIIPGRCAADAVVTVPPP